MEELFVQFAEFAKSLSEAAAVLVVTFGSLEAFLKLLWIVVTPGATHGERKAIWRRFGMWLLLGLEFALAADIIGSVVSPTWQDIGELGAIAVILYVSELLPRTRSRERGEVRRALPAAGRSRAGSES